MLTVLDPKSAVAQKLQRMEATAQAKREPLLPAKRRQPRDIQPVFKETVQVAGRDVEVWNDEFFSRLRRLHGVPDDFLNLAREKSVDLTLARSESKLGKGGDLQFTSSCSTYVIKSASGDDHKSLLVRAEAYVDRLMKGSSLIVPIYLHFRDPLTGKAYIAMRNLTTPDVKWDEKYDLKGCADDKTVMRAGKLIEPVHKRFYRMDMWCRCMWTAKRHTYFEGKVRGRAFHFDFPKSQRDQIVRMVQDDAQWLTSQGLMDYSLFVAIRRVHRSEVEPSIFGSGCTANGTIGAGSASSAVRQWAMRDGDTVVFVTLSIIDFLQPWTPGKKVAQCIKFLECNKATIPPAAYGARFKRHFAERLRGVDRLKPFDAASAVAAAQGAAC
mmetsp:Transcript_63583/g.196890  ORF Transcript_63583/g.196890 Transcript_63583/m.196890 type:complete len:383 (+) Transcript_63583:85-1233(+)